MTDLGLSKQERDARTVLTSFEQLRLEVITVNDLIIHELPQAHGDFAAAFDQAMAAEYANPRFRPRLSEIAQQMDRARSGLGHLEAMQGVGS